MQRLGFTRSAHRSDHLLLTPDTFVRAPLPGMTGATAIVHAAPALGTAFTQYTAEFEPGGSLGPAYGQRFVYVLDGVINAAGRTLSADDYCYLPTGAGTEVVAQGKARASVIERPYQRLAGRVEPAILSGSERAIAPKPLLDDADIEVRCLLTDDFAFDFAVNTMTYQPGAVLPMVEIHVMEHGLVMLSGGGIYRLGDCWYPVTAGDFIWMGPYCPQWFGALGKVPAKYLIYKDWNRHPGGAVI
uniref:Cupin 2, conserved barrel domain protein n=1 Tax=Solibacter usitatus (strain Ellin6076) TaxID=234267 RepID=Q02C41_SOLUE